jgi:Icc-related predicted phosphoesterase
VKILFTADLHLLRATQERTLLKVRKWITRHRPDAFVVAGDLSSSHQAKGTLRNLRGCFPQGPIAVCLGNHDFWMHDSARKGCNSLAEVVDQHWAPAAKSFDIALLDVGNLCLQEVTIVGGYGHYDLGFAVPDLAYEGIAVTEEDYLRGSPWAGSALRWRDFQLMPNEGHPRDVAREQVAGVRRRLSEAGDKRTILVLHTPPFEELLGVPPLSAMSRNSAPSIYAFFRAYLGNRSMGTLLRESRDNLIAVVCGHTHRQAGPMNFGDVAGINIGSDYGTPRAALYSADSNRFERLPD